MTWFSSLPKIKLTCPAPQWSTQTFVIYLGQLIHMTELGEPGCSLFFTPSSLAGMLQEKSLKSFLNCFNTLLTYRPPLTKACKYV